ncbi:MAG TPA: CAP domain-containing protein [Caulobacteraceae bacterium]|nr:CAP domain-containing protein [Caulobacteraceae bacterium]
MLVSRAILFISLVASLAAPAHARDQSILAELNFARTRPMAYAIELQREVRGSGDSATLEHEDEAAVAEAIDFLEHQNPIAPLQDDERLEAMSYAYVSEQGPTGQTGHVSPAGAGFEDRFSHSGARFMAAGEDIAYGAVSARDAVRQLIIDSNVPGRGHRRNIFNPAFTAAGASCGLHRAYRSMCVIDFGGRPR